MFCVPLFALLIYFTCTPTFSIVSSYLHLLYASFLIFIPPHPEFLAVFLLHPYSNILALNPFGSFFPSLIYYDTVTRGNHTCTYWPTYHSSIMDQLKVSFISAFFVWPWFLQVGGFAQMIVIQLCFEWHVRGFWEHALLFKDGQDSHRLVQTQNSSSGMGTIGTSELIHVIIRSCPLKWQILQYFI